MLSRKYGSYYSALFDEVCYQSRRHEQACMEEHYMVGKTRRVLQKRYAKLRKYMRRAQFGHS